MTLPTTKDPRVAAMNTIAMMELMIVIMNTKKSKTVAELRTACSNRKLTLSTHLYFLFHYKWTHHSLMLTKLYLKLIRTLSRLYKCLINKVSSSNSRQLHHLSMAVMKLVWVNKLLICHPIKLVTVTPSKMHAWETQWEIVTVLTTDYVFRVREI